MPMPHSADIIWVLFGEQLVSRHVAACTQSFELSSHSLGPAWMSVCSIQSHCSGMHHTQPPQHCNYRVSGQGTPLWLCKNGSALVREVALLEEGLWSSTVGISSFSIELSQLSAQLVKEGRKQISGPIHICLLLTKVYCSLYCEQFEERQNHMDFCNSHGPLPVVECLLRTCWLNEWNNKLQSVLRECCIKKRNTCFRGNLKTLATPPQWQSTSIGREQTNMGDRGRLFVFLLWKLVAPSPPSPPHFCFTAFLPAVLREVKTRPPWAVSVLRFTASFLFNVFLVVHRQCLRGDIWG